MTWFDAMVMAVVGVQLFNQWLKAEGRMMACYIVSIIVYTGFGVIEGYLAMRDSFQLSVALFIVVDAWGIFMSIKGIRRLRRQNARDASSDLP